MAKIDQRAVLNGQMSDLARREYLAWANAYSRILARLGLERSGDDTPSGPSLAEVIQAGRQGG
jgi:hypothetical protein